MSESIELGRVGTHNLKDIDVRIPLGELTVVTGASGSGKSSLVFDTLYAESYRRYVESLSSFARQFLQGLPKPQVRTVNNLPPAIAVRQSRSGASNRSTVGTMSELTDLVRILMTHLGSIVCPECGNPVNRDRPESVSQTMLDTKLGEQILVTAPLSAWGKISPKDLKHQLSSQGFTRLLIKGFTQKLEAAKARDLKKAAVILDRLTVSPTSSNRLIEAAQLAFKVGRGQVEIVSRATKDAEENWTTADTVPFSNTLSCPRCEITYRDPSPALLNFNHPLGACPTCQGFGQASEIDYDKVIPDQSGSLKTKGVACWNFGAHAEYYKVARSSAKRRGLDPALPFDEYSSQDWQWLLTGQDDKKFEGVEGYFRWLETKKYKAHYRIHLARYRKYVHCRDCDGARLNKQALACHLAGLNLAELGDLSVDRMLDWLEQVGNESNMGSEDKVGDDGLMGVGEALEETDARLRYLQKIGLGYLSIGRSAKTLSGGELQRINMARCLGSALTGTLYCLDEPTSGLHARDSHNLLEVLWELRDQGNTVVVVEHEDTVIKGADHLIEIGPAAGHKGGHVVYEGVPKLRPQPKPDVPTSIAQKGWRYLTLEGANTNNLKNISVRIPVGKFTAVCGVSGSGKTSLIEHTFFPILAAQLGQSQAGLNTGKRVPKDQSPAKLGPIKLVKTHRDVMLVSQAALGRSSRSNIATYLGLMEGIRKTMAAEPVAQKHGFKPGAFSFNTPGGRCEVCRGLGVVSEDLSFLGEMDVVCPTCQGRRFTAELLEVQFRGKNMNEILALTIEEAREFFFDQRSITNACQLILDMGMGYLTLGQHTSTFSGGEAQRLKLVSLMKEVKATHPSVLIFDEPTTGLSDWDVGNLLEQLRSLCQRGHTVIVVEHHLGVLRSADWLIEIGPEAAEAGGQLVYEGTPGGLSTVKDSVTRPWLWSAEEKGQSTERPRKIRSRTPRSKQLTNDCR